MYWVYHNDPGMSCHLTTLKKAKVGEIKHKGEIKKSGVQNNVTKLKKLSKEQISNISDVSHKLVLFLSVPLVDLGSLLC